MQSIFYVTRLFFFFSSRRRHTRYWRDWSSDVCSSDLIWGATLTRWVSRATKRYGSAFLSVGRVQSPTLVLIAERERERRAFVPVPYWELEVELKNGEPFTVRHQTERCEDETRARSACENIAETARVEEVQQKSPTRRPPTPFNTTSFLTAAANIGISPSRAARIAEDLYTDGYISYPRTDNTVYRSEERRAGKECRSRWSPYH